jgi:hypothetical protein
MVAHGVANSPTWVQVANPSSTPLVLRHGSHLCYFHSRDEWETQEADIDPVQDIPLDKHQDIPGQSNFGAQGEQILCTCSEKTSDAWQYNSEYHAGPDCIKRGIGVGQGEGLITPESPIPHTQTNGAWQFILAQKPQQPVYNEASSSGI